MKDLGRLITAMVTPFKENGEVDFARAKEFVLLGTGMGAAKLTVLDDVDIGDGSSNLQRVCIKALGDDWR